MLAFVIQLGYLYGKTIFNVTPSISLDIKLQKSMKIYALVLNFLEYFHWRIIQRYIIIGKTGETIPKPIFNEIEHIFL